ncbi:hypothetical protein QYE76_021795 [Lolium multiflorum]|uniref:CCHC-type domain-containing protein n=1 Tax=Lolium multiflorum TaxID=4521 RepID=A0AAD8VTG0_LOLMU|nr:hypothetical protein QYE76_021795 [Lolium multiflorum]
MLPSLMGQGHMPPKAQPAKPLGFPQNPRGINLGGKNSLFPLGAAPLTLDGKGGHPTDLAPYIKRGGVACHFPPSPEPWPPLSSSTIRCSGLGEALQLFFLHHHHHAVVLLELGGDLPHLRCPLERGEDRLRRYRMRDRNMNKELPELFSMLKSAEVEIRKENQVLMVNKTTSFKKQGKPNKGNFKKGGKKVAVPPEKPKAGPKPDTVCYYCQGKGHWKRNCPKYLADLKSGHVKKKGIFDIHVIDVYLTGSRSSA